MVEKIKKKRISTLAKSYEVSGDVLLKLLKDAGVEVKSAASMIDAETFTLVKPALLKEKEKQERKEMAKAGMKIPMKAVLKKVTVAKKLKKAEPTVKKAEPVAEKPKPVEEAPKEIAPEVKAPELAPVEEPVAKTQEQPKVEEKQPEEVKAEIKEEAAPKAEEKTEENSEEASAESQLKVTVEKPDEQLAARIQKYMDERAARRAAPKSEKGYSGRFGKVPHQDNRPKQREKTPGDRPRDVFAMRAQEAGVVVGAPGKPDTRRDVQQPKKKLKGKNKKKKTKEQIEQELSEMRSNVNKVMAQVGRGSKKVVHKKERAEETEESEEKKILNVPEFVSISELAGLMNELPNKVIAKCLEMGIMVTINQRLDHETIAILADEFGFEAKLMDEYKEDVIESEDEVDEEGALEPRAPIVTIMGHVDHGKTSILDYIRKATVASHESGGITQHIGAYQVETPSGPVCFLDTPGHEAFAAMRSRGAQVTDVIVLVIAADSQVMPQTKEAIEHAKNAKVEIVVAINKVDLPTANIDKIKSQLAEEGVLVDGWGGKVSCVEVSAKTGHGIDQLLETLALESEVLELKAVINKRAKATVIETKLDKGKGTVATVVVQEGTLRPGDGFICGSFAGRVRSLLDGNGKKMDLAGPSTPVQVLGLEGMPQAGDTLVVMNEREAREVALRRSQAAKDREMRQKRHITLDQLHEKIASGEFHEFKVIIKGDTDGSVEAIATSLNRLSTPEVKINIISQGVGAVKEADVHLAAASNALIIAFHLLPSEKVRNLAEEEGVSINYYRVIYNVVDDVIAGMEGMLDPELKEEVVGEAVILQLFKIPKIGMIAGCKVNSGMVDRESKVRLYRDGVEIGEAKVSSLKRHKDDVKSVKAGMECGIGIEGLKDIQEEDILAFFKTIKIAKKLSQTPA